MFCLEALIDLAVALLNRCSSRRRSWRWPSHTRVRNRSTTTITRFTVDNFFFFSAKLVWITAIAVVRFSRRTISRRRFPISRVIQAARRRFPSSSLLARSIFRVSVLCRFIILLRGRCVGKWKNNDFDFVYFILESSFLFQFSWSFRGNESTESTTPDLLFARRYNILFFFLFAARTRTVWSRVCKRMGKQRFRFRVFHLANFFLIALVSFAKTSRSTTPLTLPACPPYPSAESVLFRRRKTTRRGGL